MPQPESANPPGGPDEGYKNIQRQLEKARQDAKKHLQSSLEVDRIEAELKLNRQQTSEVIRILKENSADADDLEKLEQQGQRAAASLTQQHEYRKNLVDLLHGDEEDVDWDTDERLDGARQAWSKGQFADAVRQTQTVLGSSDDIDSKVDKKVKEVLRTLGMKVDSGESTSTPSPTSMPSPREIVVDPAAAKQKMNEFLQTLYKPK